MDVTNTWAVGEGIINVLFWIGLKCTDQTHIYFIHNTFLVGEWKEVSIRWISYDFVQELHFYFSKYSHPFYGKFISQVVEKIVHGHIVCCRMGKPSEVFMNSDQIFCFDLVMSNVVF